MTDIYKLTEEWATVYRPMQHGERRPRYYETANYYVLCSELVQKLDTMESPCVVVETQQEGSIVGHYNRPRYSIYFLVQAVDQQDAHSVKEASKECVQVMFDYINFLRTIRDNEAQLSHLDTTNTPYIAELLERASSMRGTPNAPLYNIDLDHIDYETINEIFDGWFAVLLQLEDVEPLVLCIDESKYLQSIESSQE